MDWKKGFGISVLGIILLLSFIFVSSEFFGDSFSKNKISGNVVLDQDGWTVWLNRDTPSGSGDYETLSDFVKTGQSCANPSAIECRRISDKKIFSETGEKVTCDKTKGLICLTSDNSPECSNYEVRFYCGGNQTCTDTCSSLNYNCGIQNICGVSVSCGTCLGGQVCDATGRCVTSCTNTCNSLNYTCGIHTICGTNINCGGCSAGYECNSVGQCVIPSCTDTCSSLGYQCGTQTICGVSVNCGLCSTGYTCDLNGQCVEEEKYTINFQYPRDLVGNQILVSKYYYGNNYTKFAEGYCKIVQNCTGFDSSSVVVKDDNVKACRCDSDPFFGCSGKSCVANVASNSYWERIDSVTCTGCSLTIPCTDSDGGIDYYVRGIVNTQYLGKDVLGDYCAGSDPNLLVEMFCQDTFFANSVDYICPNGCKDGACVLPKNPTSCFDSDKGKNYYIRGNVSGVNSKGEYAYSDICGQYQDAGKILEYYCINNSEKSIFTKCPGSCKNGACLRGGLGSLIQKIFNKG
jgi:hypothetical protein